MASWSWCCNLVFSFVGFSGNSNQEWITQACWSLPKSQTFISPGVPFFFPPALLQCVCRSKVLVLAKEHRWRIVHLRGRLKQNQKSNLNVVSLYWEFSLRVVTFRMALASFGGLGFHWALVGQIQLHNLAMRSCLLLTVVEKKGWGLHDLQGAMKPFIDPQSKVYILFLLLLKIAHQ